MTSEPPATGELFLQATTATFEAQKRLAERAIRQLSDAQLRQPLDENTNSVAVIMKHMAGNMLSRWTDFLTSDGEKPGRKRDREFIDDFKNRDEMMDAWGRGWKCLFGAIRAISPRDLTRHVTIRGESHTVIRAVHRQIDHYGYHVGQIVLVARVLAREKWTTLTVPRGGSEEYNRRVWKS